MEGYNMIQTANTINTDEAVRKRILEILKEFDVLINDWNSGPAQASLVSKLHKEDEAVSAYIIHYLLNLSGNRFHFRIQI